MVLYYRFSLYWLKINFMEITIPIEIVELENNSFHIVTTVQIGTLEGDFIIDTGASITVIDKGTPFSYEAVEDVSEINSGGIGGEINEVSLVNIPIFTIGDCKLKNIHVALIDMEYVNTLYNKHLNRRIAGLLGSDFFVKYAATIDYGSKSLTLHIKDES